MSKQLATLEYLKTQLSYDPEDGRFIWKVKKAGRGGGIGSQAGRLHPKGYRYLTLDQQSYAEHRLAWFYVTGTWPTDEIDHRNGIRDDNRFSNLVEATRSENAHNLHTRHNSVSGVTGVSWHKGHQAWRVRISINGKQVELGEFKAKAEAIRVRREAERTHGYTRGHAHRASQYVEADRQSNSYGKSVAGSAT